MTTLPPTLTALVQTFTHFLTIAIHTILHARACYPPSTFLTARAYNFPVAQSRHPRVCAWIADAVNAVNVELLKGGVKRVVLVIFSNDTSSPTSSDDTGGGTRPLERYVFDVSRFPRVSPGEVNTPIVRSTTAASTETKGKPARGRSGIDTVATAPSAAPNETNTNEQLRALLTRLSTLTTSLSPIPPGCPFTLAIELLDEEEDARPIGHPQAWIPSEPILQNTVLERSNEMYGGDRKTRMEKGEELGGSKGVVPLRAVRSGEMVFECWVEEGKAKDDVLREGSLDISEQ